MPRKYEKVQELLPVVKQLAENGWTQRQIAEELGKIRHYAVHIKER